ncbi:MAG: hypothetical protein LBS28_00045 [Streptococcaceae bacterium]|nr:hypothetical protein [Streptococcaceae bacterium]
MLIKTLINISYSCIKHEHLQDADDFLKEVESLIATQRIENCVIEKFALKFMKGFYNLINGNINEGKKLMKKAIGNFKATEDQEIVERYKTYYKEAFLQSKKKFAANDVK